MFKYSLLCAFVLLTNTVQAQSNDQGASVAGYELLKEKRLWSSSSNAAGIVFDDTHNYSNLNINYDYSNGDFHRVYTGNSVKDLNIYTEGFINLEKVFYFCFRVILFLRSPNNSNVLPKLQTIDLREEKLGEFQIYQLFSFKISDFCNSTYLPASKL